jgi:hypothetical protein
LRDVLYVIAETSAKGGVLDANRGDFVAGGTGGFVAEARGPDVKDLGEFGVGFKQVFAGNARFQAQQRIQW